MSGERTEGSLPSRLRWYVGVPLGTNPLILLDLSILLTVTSPPLKGAGGMSNISPFEGSPRAGAAEYVNRQIVKSPNLLIC